MTVKTKEKTRPKDTLLPHTEILGKIIKPLLIWYRGQSEERNLPWRSSENPYHIWLSEIMLQQTRASAARLYYERFLSALPTITALAMADEDILMKLWQGLGYYSRARNLKRAAEILVKTNHANLPETFEELLALPGIGRYTGSAIASIAFGLPRPAVDGNVLRVVSRILLSREDILKDATRRAIERALAPHYPSGKAAGELNQAFMDLGAGLCLPHGTPHCADCPLARLCLAHAEGIETELPIRKKAKARRKEAYTVLRMEFSNAIALRKRPQKGLLAGLWELPNFKGHLTREEIECQLQNLGIPWKKIEHLSEATHIFSHVEWKMQGWRIVLAEKNSTCMVLEDSTGFIWTTKKELAERYSIPSAFQYFLY